MSRMIFAACLLAVSVVAHAQTSAPPAPPVPPVAPTPPLRLCRRRFRSVPATTMMMFVSSELGARSVVKGAPYAATAVNETRQVLNDGNRIERSSSHQALSRQPGTYAPGAGGRCGIHQRRGRGQGLRAEHAAAKRARAQDFTSRASPAGASGSTSAAGRSRATAASAVEAALANESRRKRAHGATTCGAGRASSPNGCGASAMSDQ